VLGQYEKCLASSLDSVRLSSEKFNGYLIAMLCYVALNRLDEAEVVFKQAEGHGLNNVSLAVERYEIAFLKGDAANMTMLVSAFLEKPGAAYLLVEQASAQGSYGKLKSARALTRRAIESAEHNDGEGIAATFQATAALSEVEVGNRERATAEANAALKLAPKENVRVIVALVLARAGNSAEAEKLATELGETFPLDTIMQGYWLPTIRAAVALEHNNADRALELLKRASALELGAEGNLWPVYLRGEAYLVLRDGSAAAAEFQKFIDHRGMVGSFPLGALAHLGIARAYALQGDTAKARAKYQDFLALWKDADPDIPILKEAKAEYAKLQ
jgi:eukaryotic-like serine/threonine-protein kinase